MTDDQLTDAWEAGKVFPGGLSHVQHLRIAWVLHRRHGSGEAQSRLLTGTRRACEIHGCPEKFDAALTKRWAGAIREAAEHDVGATADDFIATHPEFRQGDLFGKPQRLG